jgi:CHAT domain-containing protein
LTFYEYLVGIFMIASQAEVVTPIQVGVPTVLGYRWTVNDASAKALALAFYRNLWRTFCPAEAIWQSRREFPLQSEGLDDETWASLVLLMQNP